MTCKLPKPSDVQPVWESGWDWLVIQKYLIYKRPQTVYIEFWVYWVLHIWVKMIDEHLEKWFKGLGKRLLWWYQDPDWDLSRSKPWGGAAGTQVWSILECSNSPTSQKVALCLCFYTMRCDCKAFWSVMATAGGKIVDSSLCDAGAEQQL